MGGSECVDGCWVGESGCGWNWGSLKKIGWSCEVGLRLGGVG